jgi:hypothetical protein
MKIEIEIDDLVGYQFKSGENKVIRFEDMSRREQIKVLNAFVNGYELFLTALKEEQIRMDAAKRRETKKLKEEHEQES